MRLGEKVLDPSTESFGARPPPKMGELWGMRTAHTVKRSPTIM